MSENPYERMMPQGPFGKAVDKALAEINEQPFTKEQEDEAAENAARWAALTAAQEVTKGYGVVLPMATAEALLKALRGEPTGLDSFDEPGSSLLERMLWRWIEQAKMQKEMAQ